MCGKIKGCFERHKYFGLLAAVSSLFSVTACGGSDGPPDSLVRSERVALNGSVPDVSLSNVRRGSVSSPQVGLVAYVAGLDRDTAQVVTAVARSSNPNVGAVQTGGFAVYDAEYGLAIGKDAERDLPEFGGSLVATTTPGDITLVADFNNGNLTGSDGFLTVDGSISGANLGGNVRIPSEFASVDIPLEGRIGSTGVIGTFHTSQGTGTVAGGFVGTRR